jgi:hypothetical protein
VFRKEFVRDLAVPQPGATTFQSLRCSCVRRVCKAALQEESEVRVELSKTLDVIEESLALDQMVGSRLRRGRKYFGKWRSALFHQGEGIEYRQDLVERLLDDVSEVQKLTDLKHESIP